jgi:hypothetical protein
MLQAFYDFLDMSKFFLLNLAEYQKKKRTGQQVLFMLS